MAEPHLPHRGWKLRRMVSLLFLAAAAAAHPSAEGLRLGRALAETGTLATLLPMIQKKEADELVDAHPELDAAGKARLRQVADQVYRENRERLMDAEAHGYAKRLSLTDLRAALAFQNSAPGKSYRAAIPGVTADTVQLIGKVDYKRDVLAAYCKTTGKLCPK
jgi:hypothetical protein